MGVINKVSEATSFKSATSSTSGSMTRCILIQTSEIADSGEKSKELLNYSELLELFTNVSSRRLSEATSMIVEPECALPFRSKSLVHDYHALWGA